MNSAKSWQLWLEKLSLRERVIVLLAGLLVIYGLWFLIWFNGASAQRELIATRQAALTTEITTVGQEIDVLQKVLSGDASSEKQRQIASLQTVLLQLDQDLARLSQGLVPAARLPMVLRDLLDETTGLTLEELRTGSVEMLTLGDGEASTGVYKHPVTLQLKGDYFAVMQLVEGLEALPWKMYFEQLQYRVADYPLAEVTLGVYTLSADRGNISLEPK